MKNHSKTVISNPSDEIEFAGNDFLRVRQKSDTPYSQLIDFHSKYKANIRYIRVDNRSIEINMKDLCPGTTEYALQGNDFGLLLRVINGAIKYTVWIPQSEEYILFDESGRISTRPYDNYFTIFWDLQPNVQLKIISSGDKERIVVIPILIVEDIDEHVMNEIRYLDKIERSLYRKSDWFFAERPSDVWKYLIYGSIYDPRTHHIVLKRFKCQQCAYSWWSYFGFLHKETDKRIYAIIQDEIAYSVLLDMSDNGEWGHGYWSDDIETHARFHLDGINLLISQSENTNERIWLEAAEKAMGFVSSNLMEKLDNEELWFLHDTIEHKQAHRFASNLFGKSKGNTLCINTHVQALIVLKRLSKLIPENLIYDEMYKKGLRSLKRVFEYQPQRILYRLLSSWIVRYKTKKKSKSIWYRLRNAFEWHLFKAVYWSIRSRYPRIVYPDGFIERDLTLTIHSDWYHITNIKDLLILYKYQEEPFDWLKTYIMNGVRFTRQYIDKKGLNAAIAVSPFYIEYIDILHLYNELIACISPDEIANAEEIILQESHGYSLDYHASSLMR